VVNYVGISKQRLNPNEMCNNTGILGYAAVTVRVSSGYNPVDVWIHFRDVQLASRAASALPQAVSIFQSSGLAALPKSQVKTTIGF
jgi:hypothetical protein